MANKPFFPSSVDLFGEPEEPIAPRRTTGQGCESCQRYKGCQTPKFPVHGQGAKGVLLIAESPGPNDDTTGHPLSGDAGALIRRELRKHGIDVERDCWTTHAIRCHLPTDWKDQTDKALDGERAKASKECRPKLHADVSTLRPSFIMPLGPVAVQALLGDRLAGRMSGTQPTAFIGQCIPDQDLQAWVCPIPGLKHTLKLDKKRDVQEFFRRHVAKACGYIGKPVPRAFGPADVTILETADEYTRLLRIIQPGMDIAFDYETTGLKPHREGHKIICASVAFGPEGKVHGYSGKFYANDPEFMAEWVRVLTDPKIGKTAHQSQFEDTWSKVRGGGHWVQGWLADTCLDAHIVDNEAPTSLKFVAYTEFGILGYDHEVDPYIGAKEKGGNEFNRMEEFFARWPRKMLVYCGMDSIASEEARYRQRRRLKDHTPQLRGSRFFMKSAPELARASQIGMCLDTGMLEANKRKIAVDMDETLKRIQAYPQVPKDFNPNAAPQVSKLFYDTLGHTIGRGGRVADETALQAFGTPLAGDVLAWKKMHKLASTYIDGFLREVSGGILHPSFALNKVTTYRSSCIAKGGRVMLARDNQKDPVGVPIEDVREGDLAYCYDDALRPCLRRVLWSGKTGHKEVIRLHYKGHAGRVMHLDLTPEHLVRTATGEYVRADSLLSVDVRDIRNNPASKHCRKRSVLGVHRDRSRLYVTNLPMLDEHRFIYSQVSGEVLTTADAIHHVDHNHYNNDPSNLVRLSHTEHARHHNQGKKYSDEHKARQSARLKAAYASGELVALTGSENQNYKPLSRYQCLRMLARAKGRVWEAPMDFNTFKQKCALHEIPLDAVKRRYGGDRQYVGKGILLVHLREFGLSETHKRLGTTYYNIKGLMEQWNITYHRAWGNQNGSLIPASIVLDNHYITAIEKLAEPVDVYDLHIEEFHNFIVEEICVHNSMDPNFQNIPKRDPIAKKTIRTAIKPRPGHIIIEADYKAVEVSIGYCNHHDEGMGRYLTDKSSDMHADGASKIFLLPRADIKPYRGDTKMLWTFAQFYGSKAEAFGDSKHGEVTLKVWEYLQVHPELLDHMRSQGIKNLDALQEHLVACEKDLWGNMFPGYAQWKRDIWKFYQENLYVPLKTGFRCWGPLGYNDATNYPIQGPAFHCLLWTMGEAAPRIRDIAGEEEAAVCGQIHDALVIDCHPRHAEKVCEIVQEWGTKRLPEAWDWIDTPLTIEIESSLVDGSWADMDLIEKRSF